MKRQGFLIEQIANMENLRLAFWKAQQGKEGKVEVIRFRAVLDEQLGSLRQELLSGQVSVGHYHYFTIYDPKVRLICASSFRERVLHHALMNICHESFEQHQIDTSYASRKGKGTYAAIEQARVNQRKYKWFLKMDVRKYFDSIDHTMLKAALRQRFKDRCLLSVLDTVIDSYSVEAGKGLPIGNLTSQYFANHYLSIADHFLKEQLGARAYVRYMDDMVVWDNDRERLKNIGEDLRIYLDQRLCLTLKPFCLNRSGRGLPFCGYRLFPEKLLLGCLSKQRFRMRYNEYDCRLQQGEWSQGIYQQHILPLLAYVRHADSWGFRNSLTQKGISRRVEPSESRW